MTFLNKRYKMNHRCLKKIADMQLPVRLEKKMIYTSNSRCRGESQYVRITAVEKFSFIFALKGDLWTILVLTL